MRNTMMIEPAVIHRYPVQSSLLVSVGYCPVTCIFDIELKDGSLYRYYGVPAHICWNLLCADSKGRYFNQYVKSAFTYQRVSPPRRSFGVRPPCPRSRWAPRRE
jgi:hypothetical protein